MPAPHLRRRPGVCQVGLRLARLGLAGVQPPIRLLQQRTSRRGISGMHAMALPVSFCSPVQAGTHTRQPGRQHLSAPPCRQTHPTHLDPLQPVLLAPQRPLPCRQLLRLRLGRRLSPLQLLLSLLHLRRENRGGSGQGGLEGLWRACAVVLQAQLLCTRHMFLHPAHRCHSTAAAPTCAASCAWRASSSRSRSATPRSRWLSASSLRSASVRAASSASCWSASARSLAAGEDQRQGQ